MELRLLDRDDVRRSLNMARAIELMSEAFTALSEQRIESPLRTMLSNEHGTVLYKPAYSADHRMFCIKVVSVFPGNATQGEEVTPGLVLVNSTESGRPVALMDAGYLTSLRTGAATGLATRLLSDSSVKTAALFGTGGQAAHQLEAMLAVRQMTLVYVFSRLIENARRFCEQHQDLADECQLVPSDDFTHLAECQLITTVTTCPNPLFEDAQLARDVHINAIGSLGADRSEIALDTLRRANLFVDQRDACLAEAGEIQLLKCAGESVDVMELGEVIASRPELTKGASVFKSVGNAAQDIVCAAEIIRHAEQHGIGRMVEL